MASEAAYELADKLLADDRVHYFSNGQFKYCPTEAANLIQAALSDLLEKAEHTLDVHQIGGCVGNKTVLGLAQALEPWKEK